MLVLFPRFSLGLALRARARTELANNQDQTINRLLRAQTSKSRSKLDAPAESTSNSPAPPGGPIVEGEEVESKPKTRGRELPVNENMIRIVSRLDGDGGLTNLVAVTEGREGWIAV
jgi:Ino eighty subunit 2